MARGVPGSGSGARGVGRGGATTQKKDQGGGSLISKVFQNPVVQVGENLLDDVKDTVIGIPTGLVNLAVNPVASGKAIGAGMWHTYSPLFAGDFKTFGKQVYDHPLAPLLDVLSVATLGAGSAAKGASVLSKAGVRSARVERLANPKVRRKLDSGHTDGLEAVVEHTKAYHRNPFIRARQKTAEGAVNHMAGLLPSWFQVDKAIPDSVLSGFSGAQRADAWRWYRADKYDEASRRHTTAAAGSLAIAGIMHAAKRLNQNPGEAGRAFVPNIVQNLKDHAHVVKESDLPEALRREMTDAELAKLTRQERARFKAEQAAKTPPGTSVVKYDPAVARAGKLDDPDVVDSYGVEIDDVDVPNAKTIDDRYVFVDKNAEAAVQDWFKRNQNVTGQDLADFIAGKGKFEKGAGLGGKLVTSDWRRAARDADGNFLVARNHGSYLEEAARSTHFLAKLGRSATTAWKWAILGIRPAYVVNNAVGNYFMYFVSMGPQGIRGLVDATRQLHSQKDIDRSWTKEERRFFKTSIDWQDRYYLGLHRGFAKDASDLLAGETIRLPIGEVKGAVGKFKRIAGAGFYDFTHKIADRAVRRAAINTILRDMPEVQKLMKGGMHFDDAAAAVSQNRAVREAVQQRVNDVLGQYHYLNPAERAIRAVVPFYTWDRAIVRHGAHLYLDRPLTAAAMTQVGAMGRETTEQILGEIPDFLRGAIPLSLVGMPEQVDGRVPILGTAGYNPYSSLDSIIKAGQALTTGDVELGEVVAGQANPFLTGTIEQITGTKLLSGARLPESSRQGGLLPNVLAGLIANLPQARIIDTAVTGPDGDENSLYPGDVRQFINAYMGVPSKALNLDVAKAMAERDDGVPASSKRKGRGSY